MNHDKRWLSTSLTVDQRVEALLAVMTPEEKVGQLLQLDASQGLQEAVEGKLVGSILHASPQQLVEAADYVRATRLQIPLLVGDDLIHGYSFWAGSTIFPNQLTMAATWDPRLLERAARVTAIEAAPTGVHWAFSPVLCIARELRWGRVDETFGEDPYLIGELASAMVRGYQGNGLSDPDAILATAKHFAGYSETQGGRDASEADLSQRKLRSWFLPPFERVAREGAATFMLGYSAIEGVPVTVNKWILNDVLRGEWGYKGMLITDWNNVGALVENQRMQPDYTHAAAAAVKAGNDMIMTTPSFFEGALEALRTGLVAESDIDEAVRRVLSLKFRLGLFENPRLPDLTAAAAVMGIAPHAQLNLEIARRSVVVLRNDGVLPLAGGAGAAADSTRTDGNVAGDAVGAPTAPKKIALLGPNADDPDVTLGDWAGRSGQASWMKGQPRELISTVLDGLRAQVPADWSVSYAIGADILTTGPDPEGEFFDDGQPRPQVQIPCQPDPAKLAEAVALFDASDYGVVVVGDRIELVGEGRSTATLNLFGAQNALIDAIAERSEETGKPFILVLLASKPLILPPSAERASALLWVGNPGMKGGQAIAEVLLGQVEPSGRLPITFPRHVGQQPIYYNQIRSQHGTRYADLTQDPAFAFGEGLSYTTTEFGRPTLKIKSCVCTCEYCQAGDCSTCGPCTTASGVVKVGTDDSLLVSVPVSNTGSRPVRETVQVYIRDLVTSVTWADKELKGFTQVELAPGESKQAVVELAVADCSLVNAEGVRLVEPGRFEILVGRSSKDADLTAVPFEVVE